MSETHEVEQTEHTNKKGNEIHYKDIKPLLNKNESELDTDERKLLMKFHSRETNKYGEEAHNTIIKMALPIIIAQNGRYVQTKDLIHIGKTVMKADGNPVGDKGNVRHVLQAHGLHPLVRPDAKVGWAVHTKRLHHLCTEHNIPLPEDFVVEPIAPKKTSENNEKNDQKRFERALMKKTNEALKNEFKKAKKLLAESSFDEAANIYNKVLAEYPTNEQAQKGLEKVAHKRNIEIIQQHINKATEMLKNDNFDEAKIVLNDILNIDKDNKFATVKMKYIEKKKKELLKQE